MPRSQRTAEIASLVTRYYKTNDRSLVKDISDSDLDNAITEYKPYNIGNDLKTRDYLDRLKRERQDSKDASKLWDDLIKSNIVKYIFIGLFALLAWLLDWFTWLFNLFS
jgi:hypothetical protein